ncbi:MAG: hypothetical protein ACOVP1_01930 [Bacteroidia bacterium]
MNNKIALLLLGIGLLFNFQVNAQKNKQEKRQEMKANAQAFKEKLNLTPEQQTKIKEIRKRYRDEIKAKLTANPNASKEEKRKLMKQAMESADVEINALLTTEQQNIYKAEKERRIKERREKMKEKKGEGKGKNKGKDNGDDDKELEDAIIEGM